MPNVEPCNTPPPAYTPGTPATAPERARGAPAQAGTIFEPAAKKGESMDIHPQVVELIKQNYIKEFEKQVNKHDSNFIGSLVINKWRKDTLDTILASIKDGTAPFQNIPLTNGRKKSNLNSINYVFQNHYHHKLKVCPGSSIVVLHEDAIKIIERDDIQQQVDQGKNYQTVVKDIWDGLTEEKQNQWNKEVKQVNITGNQSRFQTALPALFKVLATSGRVGPVEALVCQNPWIEMEKWLAEMKQSPHHEERSKCTDSTLTWMDEVPWGKKKMGFPDTLPTVHLWQLPGQNWTNDTVQDDPLTILPEHIDDDSKLAEKFIIQCTSFTEKLLEVAAHPDKYWTEKSWKWLQDIGKQVFGGKKVLITSVHLGKLLNV
ncbi:hypothetical protein BT96DRAFT_996448 [Gymnopus androsaceus JB14]|uniref:Uncharacterized protein n=1 Tax=Gymnopus androsaceus JB14 TaxID=1447944 RepID=A0A6A4HI27_9AGAR|nr:hypothetical protein BT96DRAFT_996448 [Gymnopus androsaceus JB14]